MAIIIFYQAASTEELRRQYSEILPHLNFEIIWYTLWSFEHDELLKSNFPSWEKQSWKMNFSIF